jgi:hypothetical protein
MAERMSEKPWLKLVIPRVWGARWEAMVKNRELHWKLSKDKAGDGWRRAESWTTVMAFLAT